MSPINPNKTSKYRNHLNEVLTVACKLDDLPDDPNQWTADQRKEAHDLILRIGGPESFLRRFARADLA
jgi:hypothetical protein